MGRDLTKTLELAVACARQGRTIASIGAYLTSAEQEQIPEIYSRLVNKEIIEGDSPAMALITSKTGKRSKVTQSEAINWFIETHPTWSIPLQKKLKEMRPPKIKTILAYGLREGQDFSDEYYVSVISDVANMSESRAKALYENFINPQLRQLEELSGLIEVNIKKKE
tara:strand:+ start:181 stop:681 length:501 start_codon:yes stop_codon:yes gene_type:complete